MLSGSACADLCGRLFEITKCAFAALPRPSAVRLCLTGRPFPNFPLRGYASKERNGGAASNQNNGAPVRNSLTALWDGEAAEECTASQVAIQTESAVFNKAIAFTKCEGDYDEFI